jgi:hypothetical protein
LTERKFSLVLSMEACFCAVQAGALVVCLGIMLLDSPLAILAGIGLWVGAQVVIVPIALL